MTPILFAANETAFTSNGIGRLTDAVSCLVTEERNGQYELVMQYPIDGEMFGEIACGKYIFATHDESKTPQAFQIYRISAPLEGVVTINAWHISYALNTIIVEPFTAGSCTAAIAGVKTHSMNTNPFTFSMDKQVTADFELTIPASARAVLGGMSGSILDVYGKGEYEFDMYAVKLYLNRGQNRGVSIRYGKNLAKLDQTLDASNVYNSVVPYWTNGETTVVSDAIITRTGESVGNTISLDLSTYFMDEPTLVELKAKAQTIVDASEDYTLKENVKVDFVALWQTEEYKNYAALERVFLCDTVNIFYEKLGVNVTAKVIKVVYDTLRERYASIELGEPTTSLYQQIQTSVVGDVLEVVPSKSQMQSAIDHATELIGGGFGGYIKFNYLSDGTPSEMLVMDSPDEATAINIIRLNQNGLGFSTDGGSTYANAWTIDGNLNASFITTGVLDADLMTAGMIQDASGKNYWNLDTGQFATQQGQIADFDIHTDELLGGNYGFNNTGTRIKRGSFSTTYTQAYTVGGQLQIYTHFNSYGSEVSFYITDPSRTTYPLLLTELAGRIVPNYNATLDYRELQLYGGSTEMIALRATSNPYIYVNKRMQIGASTNMLDNTLFGSLQIRKDTGTEGTLLSGKGAAFGKSAITDNLVDSAWELRAPTAWLNTGVGTPNTTDILLDADNMVDGRAQFFTLAGSLYTGSVPNSLYQYGGGYVIRRAANSIWAVIFPSSNSAQPIVNYNGGNGWLGWQSFLTTAGTADYVTLQITSGIWTYRQWASGVAECWGKYSESTAAAFDPTGNVYYRVLPTISIPGGWFNASPSVTAGLDFGNIGAAQVAVSSATELRVAILSAVSSARACNVSLHCRGTWK